MSYKTIKDFPNYEVSTLGHVRRIANKKKLKFRYPSDGISTISILRSDTVIRINASLSELQLIKKLIK